MATQLIFILLQAADLATTMIAIHMGGVEKNALISHFLLIGSLQGLLFSKLLILAIAVGAVMARRHRVLRWANVAFTGVVLWNITVIIRLALRSHGA